MKKGMCNGCDNKIKVPQLQRFYPDGVTPREKPISPKKNYCTHYGIHFNDAGGGSYIDRINDGDRPCSHYISGGIS